MISVTYYQYFTVSCLIFDGTTAYSTHHRMRASSSLDSVQAGSLSGNTYMCNSNVIALIMIIMHYRCCVTLVNPSLQFTSTRTKRTP